MENGVDTIASLMEISANNAPKAEGDNFIDITKLDKAEKEILAEELFQMGDELNDEEYVEAGERVEKSEKVLLIGLDEHKHLDLDCMACGFENCEEFSKINKKGIFEGPNCVFRVLDLGIAIGKACSTAGIHNIETDIIIKAGLGAKSLGLTSSRICIALPIYVEKTESYY